MRNFSSLFIAFFNPMSLMTIYAYHISVLNNPTSVSFKRDTSEINTII